MIAGIPQVFLRAVVSRLHGFKRVLFPVYALFALLIHIKIQ